MRCWQLERHGDVRMQRWVLQRRADVYGVQLRGRQLQRQNQLCSRKLYQHGDMRVQRGLLRRRQEVYSMQDVLGQRIHGEPVWARQHGR